MGIVGRIRDAGQRAFGGRQVNPNDVIAADVQVGSGAQGAGSAQQAPAAQEQAAAALQAARRGQMPPRAAAPDTTTISSTSRQLETQRPSQAINDLLDEKRATEKESVGASVKVMHPDVEGVAQVDPVTGEVLSEGVPAHPGLDRVPASEILTTMRDAAVSGDEVTEDPVPRKKSGKKLARAARTEGDTAEPAPAPEPKPGSRTHSETNLIAAHMRTPETQRWTSWLDNELAKQVEVDKETEDIVARLSFDARERLGLDNPSDPGWQRESDRRELDAIEREMAYLEQFGEELDKEEVITEVSDETGAADETVEDETVEKPVDTRSRSQKRVDAAKFHIRRWLARGKFQLSGDKRVYDKETRSYVIKHSSEVKDAIEETLNFFGIEHSDEAEARLFEAFQVYRGMGLDREQELFRTNPDDVDISDGLFVLTLAEMRNNTVLKNNPFAYTHPHFSFANRERYPTIPSMRLAEFFTQNTTGANALQAESARALVEVNILQWNEIVRPRMIRMAEYDQQESLYDLVETVVDDLPSWAEDAVDVRPGGGRFSLSELLEVSSEFAKANNDENMLLAVAREQYRRELRAIRRRDRRRRRGELDRKPLDADGVVRDPEGFWENASVKMKSVSAVIRTIQVIGLLPLAPTGSAEKGFGIASQHVGLRLLRGIGKLRGVEYTAPTKASLDRFSEPRVAQAVAELIQLLIAQGQESVIDAAVRGIKFDKETLREERRAGGAVRRGAEAAVDAGMSFTTGDWFGKPATAKIFLDYFVYQLSRTNPLDLSAEQIDEAIRRDPEGFLREAVKRPEGMAALVYASNTSLAGVDPMTETLRKATANGITDFSVGFLVGWFLKFGIKGAMRMIPFSNTMVYAIKKGAINPARARVGKRNAETGEDIADSNEFLYAGNETFWRGLGQNTVIDLARFGGQATIYIMAWGLVTMFGGIEPPDDDDKKHLWHEWKIGGEAVKENWYWNELLGFAMPFAVAMHAGADTGDNRLARQILWEGVITKLEDNPWTNALDMIDLVNNWDRNLVEAQARAEGYEGGTVSDSEFARMQTVTFLLSRVGKAIEPAMLMQLYREHGIGMNKGDLAHSSSMIYTGDENDPTDPTTWSDAQLRRTTMNHPSMGFLLNVLSGFYTENPDVTKTGYMRDQMPLVSNMDPAQMMWVSEFSVLDENGEYIPGDKWTEEQIEERVQGVIDLLSNGMTPSDLAANGVAIPYDARHYTADFLYRKKNALNTEYFARDAAGEWYPAYDLENKRAKNAAYEELVRQKAEIDVMLDALFSDEIPYTAMRYNRWETNYRPVYTWKEGTEMFGRDMGGQPATKLDYRMFGADKIDFDMYAAGDHKSTLMPWLTVDDRGEDTYDAQTPLAWQTDATDMDFIRREYANYTIPKGLNAGRDILSVMTGDGATGPGADTGAPWDTNKLLYGSRAMVPVEEPVKKLEREDYVNLGAADAAASPVYGGGGAGGWSSWGSGGYAPNIYSHAPYNLNADKPARAYTKTPSYTRFDYLRPSVKTKGSREAYRREDM